MANKIVHFRYNPSKRSPGRPWQFKVGQFGRASRTNILSDSGLTPQEIKVLKANKGKWFRGADPRAL